MKRLLLLLACLSVPALAQVTYSPLLVGNPPGGAGAACNTQVVAYLAPNGSIYTCVSSIWTASGGGGGSGTLTNVATSSPITGGPITTTGTIACPTCVTSAASLTNLSMMSGAGLQGSKITNITTDAGLNNLNLPGSIATGGAVDGSCDGTAGCLILQQGTQPSGQSAANGIQHVAPTSVTSYRVVEPGAAASGIPVWANSSSVVTESIQTLGTGVQTALGTAVSGSGAFCLASGSSCASASGGGIVTYSGPSLTLTGTLYFPIGGGGASSGTEANVDVEAPSVATVTNFYAQLSATPTTGTIALTWRKNGADTAVTCTITSGAGSTCNDTTHSFSVAQGDLIDIKTVSSGSSVAFTLVMATQFGTTGSSGTVNTGSINQIGWYAANGTAISGLSTANSGVLITSSGGVPSIGTTLPNINIGTPTGGVLTNATGLPTAGLVNNAVTSAKMAVVNTYRQCDIPVGDTSGSAIASGQMGPQSRICFIPAAATIVEMDVNADAGTPNVIVGRNRAGSIVNVVSTALATAASGGIACSNTGGTTGLNGATTCSATLQNTGLNAGDYLELVSGTPGGTAKFFVAHITYTVN